MERESFEDEKIGGFLNKHFVSIKVDREERPDVDKIYMTFIQATTGGGGWPMSVFLTPDLKPFFGGTYFPPDNRQGRPGFLHVLRQIAGLWQERHEELTQSAEEIQTRLATAVTGPTVSNNVLASDVLSHAARVFKSVYDPHHGGFGDSPKFPQPSVPLLLLRCARRFHDDEAVQMVLHTCERMAAGGICDQLGGGFARYSVDAKWLVPHFEKMLYDNAQLVELYLGAHLLAKNEQRVEKSETAFATVARGILDYVLRDMTHPNGGFYSAEDADSEGHEGKFYCWTKAELHNLLTNNEFNVVVSYFGITDQGNFVDHSHPEPLPHQNVLSIAGIPVDKKLLESVRRKMFEARSRRIRPHLDDKILTSWNGLMLGAMARAGAMLNEEKYRTAAKKNFAFILEQLWDQESGTLFHRWRDGERDHVQLLQAYAFLLFGVVEFYETTLDPRHLDFCVALAEAMIAKFYDPENGGFWQGSADAKDLILRLKDDYDGAEPAGNSVAVLSLLKLSSITGRQDLRGPAETTLRLFAHRLQNFPQAMAFMLHAVDFWLEEPRRVVIAGDPRSAEARELLLAAHSVYQPNKVILGNAGAVDEFSRTLSAKDGPVVYLCTGQACQPPTNRPAELYQLLC